MNLNASRTVSRKLRWEDRSAIVAVLGFDDLMVGAVEFRCADFLRHVPVLDVVFGSP